MRSLSHFFNVLTGRHQRCQECQVKPEELDPDLTDAYRREDEIEREYARRVMEQEKAVLISERHSDH